MTAANILQSALGHMQDRAATYDKPDGERSMGATVLAFAAITGVLMTEEQGLIFAALAFSNGIDWQNRSKNFKNISGLRFGRLNVIGASGNAKSGQAYWVCLCGCGKYREVLSSNLLSGRQRSCGCLRDEDRAARATASRKTDEEKRQGDIARKSRYNATEKGKQSKKRYFEKNRDAVIDRTKKWAAQNPESGRSSVRNRRSAIRNAEGFHTRKDIDIIGIEQGWMCAGCGSDVSAGYHVDHVHPLSKGGSNWPENLQILCAECNLKKSAKSLSQFMKELWPSLFSVKPRVNFYEA